MRREVRHFAVVLHASGELDLTTTPVLGMHLNEAEAEVTAPAPVVVDLRHLTFFGSSGMSLLLSHQQVCHDQRTPLRVVAGSDAVLRPLRVAGVESLLDLYPTISAALAA
ncbi:STAS domain-containing protein [Umezawaea beigongshangensis]|uniref:STAS domain-containing protein n=1 Tax=Umezawaea beigongshangensis TaxID=2780383 RepID=UPI0018F186B4|nr:STAS domain-containing protein [Umezawaea beigongshangensis]